MSDDSPADFDTSKMTVISREVSGWQPMETAPKDQTIIEGQLPGGAVKRMIWAWGGGWAIEWDKRRPLGIGGWISLNDTHQPVQWRSCGGLKPGM